MSYTDQPDRKDVIIGLALAGIMAFLLIIYVAAPV
jgi:hypothetical protein